MERIVYNYCAVIGVDGMGAFNADTPTPNLDRIFQNGACTCRALSMDPTISAENWGAMLLGADPTVHKLTNSIVSNRVYTNRALPSVFTRLRRAFPDAYLASVVNWDPINHGIVEHDVGVDLVTAADDEALTPLIVERVANKPRFLFVQFDNVDGAGHRYVYGTEKHLEQIRITDGYIGQIFDAYEKAGILDETLFIVTADHGGFNHGHGGYTDGEKYVFLGVRGRGIEPSEIGYARTKDIAALVLYSLGLDVPAYDKAGFSSQIPAGVFPWYDGQYLRPAFEAVTPASCPTPAPDAPDGLFAVLKKEDVCFYLPFDHSLTDAAGNHAFSETGTVKYYAGGVFGAKAEFGATGYAVTKAPAFGPDGFSAAMWLELDGSLTGGAVILTSFDHREGAPRRSGFEIEMKNNDTVVRLFDELDDVDAVTPFPGEAAEGWLHLTVSVDRKNRELRVYHNFTLAHVIDLEDHFCRDIPMPGLALGSDLGGVRNREANPCIFRMDEVLLLNRPLTDEDVKALERHYRRAIKK